MIWVSAVILLGIVGLLYASNQRESSGASVQLRDIHGLSFSSDGSQLFVPAHDGLLVYENSSWSAPDLPVHDYMGYSGVDDGFFSSGHPGPGSNLINPLGLVRSTDGGRTLKTLAFSGDTDFHLMGAGYENHAIYVINPAQNSLLPPGMHYTVDEGQTWKQSRASGINDSPIQLAIHPIQPETIAVATQGGLFLSNDYGDTFTQVTDSGPVTSVSFDPNGERILYGYQEVFSYQLSSEQIVSLDTRTITGDDAVAYIAINPTSDQVVYATYSKDIYLSQNDGQSWEVIAEQGLGGS